MAEYESFHYLMHKDAGPAAPDVFIKDKPKPVPKFLELWPAEGDAAERRCRDRSELGAGDFSGRPISRDGRTQLHERRVAGLAVRACQLQRWHIPARA